MTASLVCYKNENEDRFLRDRNGESYFNGNI